MPQPQRFAGVSIVEDTGVYESGCGYCRSASNTSVSHGMWAHRLTVDDYEALLDRGWRRSGTWLYKPMMERTCCPQYTIRLRARDFQPTKEQRKVERRLAKFLAHGGGEQEEEGGAAAGRTDSKRARGGNGLAADCSRSRRNGGGGSSGGDEWIADTLATVVKDAFAACAESLNLPQPAVGSNPRVVPPSAKARPCLPRGTGFTCAYAHSVAAAARRQGATGVKPQDVAELLASHVHPPAGVSCRPLDGYLNFCAERWEECRPGVHERGATRSSPGSPASPASAGAPWPPADAHAPATPPLPRRFEVRTLRSAFDPEEFDLWRRYQLAVHGSSPEEVTRESFEQFLVDSPLIDVEPGSGRPTPSCGFGSFHQQYRVDGKLIAVGVVDILPSCFSSKYLFWDPDYKSLSLGKVTAMREIAWVAAAQEECPSLQHYYLGFYIHTCPKMSYKAQYHPSELMCPVRLRWVPYARCKPLLDQRKFATLAQSDEDGEVANGMEGAGAVTQPDQVSDEAVADTLLFLPGAGLFTFGQANAAQGSGVSEHVLHVLTARLRAWHLACGPIFTKRAVLCLSDAQLARSQP